MKRKDFLQATMAGAAALAVSPLDSFASKLTGKPPISSASDIKISFQESTAPGKTLEEKFDFMAANGVTGFEPWGANLPARVEEIQKLCKGRNIKVSAICAGFKGFILAEDPAVKAEFDHTMREIIIAAGELGSVGVIMVPAFNGNKPCRPHTAETRQYLVEELAALGEFALKNKTTVILEPLNRREAFYLRQVGDAASICRDTKSAGVMCMGDFWHMSEETSDEAAFLAAGKYLKHVHIASRGTRNTPGEDGQADNYVGGFSALKRLGYPHWVSFECGCKSERSVAVPAALKLLREQWQRA
ncbi:Sugar phosphate isomerases/epimerases family protein YcjR [Mucinivorans hirudinis]|uniref:Sugar phosphate isomerases/epimerases family protein YcjR n=1 Tax=Mucinivorans hirudinis TaxID=1433126 RepID=A0A060RDF0_9BACT|nr:Sugar phosphate isomerases/epimerases family protein YcjR [Mucinivorans hirudinis]